MNKKSLIISLFALLLLCQCGPATEQEVTDEFNKRSFVERAEYYRDIQSKSKFADCVFKKLVLSELDSCSYADLQNIRSIVENTPAFADVDRIYKMRRDTAQYYAEKALFDFAIDNKQYLAEVLAKNIYNELKDSRIIFNTMKKVIKEYKGIFGKVFDSEEDFQEEWDNIINNGALTQWAESLKCLNEFKVGVDTAYKEYVYYNCPSGTSILNLPDSIHSTFEMPHEIVAAYIKGEKKKTIEKAVGIVTDVASEMISARRDAKRGIKPSYEIDWEDELDKDEAAVEEMMQNMEDDEKLAYALSENIRVDAVIAIMDCYMTYFDNQTNNIISQMLPNYTPKPVPQPESKQQVTVDNKSKPSQNTSSPADTKSNRNQQSSALPGEYPFASQRLLTADELKKYSKAELKIMRNEIYARHGYIFIAGREMDQYFRTQSWYQPKYKDVNKMFSDIERKNIQTISAAEKK